MEKHSVSRLSYLFAHLHLLSSDSFSSTLLPSNLSLLSASALVCFSSVHIVGSLTSKLPSIISKEDQAENLPLESSTVLKSLSSTYFPTTLCGVRVFDSVSRASSTASRPISHTHHTQLTYISHTPLPTTIFVTHYLFNSFRTQLTSISHTSCTTIFVTRYLSHTTHTQLCQPSFTHLSYTSHTTHLHLTHIFAHNHLCHTLSFTQLTHNFVNHLSHIFPTQVTHPPSFHVAGVALGHIHILFA